ncbi:phage tail length tape measure family protein [Asticcacaulis endophyticus]|uniref:Bacteriophage tail tape measure N-terminal domain-containing protein n=1 Tax=Asticcacaulis endophyticus TaxID=1395890 RepID=A0A918PTR8_9CAUL|nr:phage tail length tape measure family protein [Asticcacaulis endophyticus]GGZ21696.1 hypothetical protein GCM10011273_03090 [Asticcacaulis endophyticus]
MDVASLGIAVDSSQAKGASGDLNALTESARRADSAIESLGDEAQSTAGSFDRMAASVARTSGVRKLATDIDRVGKSAQANRHHVLNMGHQFIDLGVQGVGGANMLVAFIQQAAQMGPIAAQAEMSVTQWARAFGLLNPVVLATTVAVGVAAGAFALFKSDVDKAANNDDFVKSLGLTDKELKKLGDTSVTVGDMFKGLWMTIDEGGRVSKVFTDIKTVAVDSFRAILDAIKTAIAGLYGADRAWKEFKAGRITDLEGIWEATKFYTKMAEARMDDFGAKVGANATRASEERLTKAANALRGSRSDRSTRQPRYEGILESGALNDGFDFTKTSDMYRDITDRFAAMERVADPLGDKLKKLNSQFDVTGIPNPAIQRMEAFADAARSVGENLGYAAAYGDKLGESVTNSLRRIAAEWAANKLGDIFASMVDGKKGNSISDAGGFSGYAKSLFSFDGGGFTGNGSRSGGIDGKGGFPAILHPRETVTDHTKGQGGFNFAPNIQINGEALTDRLMSGIRSVVEDNRRYVDREIKKSVPAMNNRYAKIGTYS